MEEQSTFFPEWVSLEVPNEKYENHKRSCRMEPGMVGILKSLPKEPFQ